MSNDQKTQPSTQSPLPPAIANGTPNLMWSFLHGFLWLNTSLQRSIQNLGWPRVSTIESQILLLVALGVTRLTDIAITLDVSKQAINQANKKLIEKGLIKLVADPDDRRSKIILFDEKREDMLHDAFHILAELEEEFARRMGKQKAKQFMSMMQKGIGAPLVVDKQS